MEWSTPAPSRSRRFMTDSDFMGCSTGRSPGFAPLRVCRPRWRHADNSPEGSVRRTSEPRRDERRLNLLDSFRLRLQDVQAASSFVPGKCKHLSRSVISVLRAGGDADVDLVEVVEVGEAPFDLGELLAREEVPLRDRDFAPQDLLLAASVAGDVDALDIHLPSLNDLEYDIHEPVGSVLRGARVDVRIDAADRAVEIGDALDAVSLSQMRGGTPLVSPNGYDGHTSIAPTAFAGATGVVQVEQTAGNNNIAANVLSVHVGP